MNLGVHIILTRFCENCECELIMKELNMEADELNSLWKLYGLESDANMTGDARELKRTLHKIKQCGCHCHVFTSIFES